MNNELATLFHRVTLRLKEAQPILRKSKK